MSYLFLINIGPVQDFIASARRPRDLYCGSWLLSDLARTVALQIMEKNTLESLVFPAPIKKEDLESETFNVANKILALIEQQPQRLAQYIKEKMQDRLHTIRDEAYRDIRLPRNDQEMAYKQIDDLIEFQWVALPYDKENHRQKGYYENKRSQLEALMGARKNTRNFCAVPWKSMYIPKSSIDGKLESVIPEDRYPSRGLSYEEKQVKISELYQQFRAGPAERLSGVDLLKRHATKPKKHSIDPSKQQKITTPEFEALSTSHMAALPFLKRLKCIQESDSEHVKKAWLNYVQQFRKVGTFREAERMIPEFPDDYLKHPILGWYDGGMLFEDQLVDMLCLPASDPTTMTRIQPVRDALRGFYQAIDKYFAAPVRPSPYYAILQADGDSMGKVIDAQGGYDKHRKFSQALSSFAKGVNAVIKDHEGALVYAGGDDVLAFLPLHTVVQCADELAKKFREELNSFADSNLKPTLSVGVAIVHYLEPLKRARQLAKQAEDRAKEVEGKNALAVTISKRSGENHSIAGSWEAEESSQSIGGYLENLISLYIDKIIPGGTAYELRELAIRLNYSASSEEKIIRTLRDVMKLDAQRILHRKLCVSQSKPSEKDAREKADNALKERIDYLFKDQELQYLKKQNASVALNEFINELIVAQTLAEARQLAEPKSKEATNDHLDH
jgi:CRISPR-associated protein Cmr2